MHLRMGSVLDRLLLHIFTGKFGIHISMKVLNETGLESQIQK